MENLRLGWSGPIADPRITGVTSPATNTSGFSASQLPNVSDPEQTMANISRNQYEWYRQNFDNFEQGLLDRASNDTSLIDNARENAEIGDRVGRDVAARNASRYGVALTGAQKNAQQRGFSLTNALNTTDALNNATLQQTDLNEGLRSGLINIGQGLNAESMSNLSSAAASQSQRENAYENARTNASNQQRSTLTSLAGLGIMALAL